MPQYSEADYSHSEYLHTQLPLLFVNLSKGQTAEEGRLWLCHAQYFNEWMQTVQWPCSFFAFVLNHSNFFKMSKIIHILIPNSRVVLTPHPESNSSEVWSIQTGYTPHPIGLQAYITHCVNIERLGECDFLSCQALLWLAEWDSCACSVLL